MYGILIVLHVFICIALVMSVLLQSSKGEGLAGAFGGSSLTGTVFGGRGAATFLSRATTVLAVAFMTSSIVLTFIHPATSTTSVIQGGSAVEEAARQGRTPAAPPVTPSQGTDQQSGSTPPVDPNADLFAPETPAEDAGQEPEQAQPETPDDPQ